VGLKQPGRGADYSPPTSAKVKNGWNYLQSLDAPSWHGVLLKKAQGQRYLCLIYSPNIESVKCIFVSEENIYVDGTYSLPHHSVINIPHKTRKYFHLICQSDVKK
jgi:hypothetical protein